MDSVGDILTRVLLRYPPRCRKSNWHSGRSWGQIAGTKRTRVQSTRKLLIPLHAGVAKLADAQDLKSWVPKGACGFDSRPRQSCAEYSPQCAARAQVITKYRDRRSLLRCAAGFAARSRTVPLKFFRQPLCVGTRRVRMMNQHGDVSADDSRPQRSANASGMHQLLLALAVTAAVTITAAGQSVMIVPEGTPVVPEGTPVRVRLLQFISSETSQPRDAVRLEISEDVVVKNLVVIARHTPVVGSITTAKAYRSSSPDFPWWTRPSPGKLVFTITQTRSVDGTVIRLLGPIVGGNQPKKDPSLRWHHEGEVFDAIVVASPNGNSY